MFNENIQTFYGVIINYSWLILASFFSALTVITIKYYLKYKNKNILLLTVLVDIGLIYSYIRLLQKYDILTSFLLVKIISVLIVLLAGIMIWDVKLTNQKIIGIIFAFITMYLLA